MRDSGKAAGDEPLFGPVLNVKVFDYRLELDGVEAITHTLATGPVNDLELALFPDEQGDSVLKSSPVSCVMMKRRLPVMLPV